MRRLILLCLLMFTVSSVAFAQQMTDEQVILYVQEAQKLGKTQQQMMTELMRKGVTKEQVQRIQSKYGGKSDGSAGDAGTGIMQQESSRMRTQKNYDNKSNRSLDDGLSDANSKKQSIRSLRNKRKQQLGGNSMLGAGELGYVSSDDSYGDYLYEGEIDPTQQIFGHNIFDNEYLTFEEMTEDAESNIDTENAQVYYTEIHGNTALVSVKADLTIVSWNEQNRILSVVFDGEVEEDALKVAKSVTRIK